MDKKYFIRIINEEIKNFDFLNNEESLKEQENIDLLMNEDLQKQFICDSLLNRNDKIKITNIGDARIGGNWNSDNVEDNDTLTIIYNMTLAYTYDASKKPIIFDLAFDGNKIGMKVVGSKETGGYMTPPHDDSWINNINWYDIDVSLLDGEGNEVQFLAYEKAPQKIQNLFVREFLEQFISTYTEMDVREKPDTTSITQYC